MEIQVVSSGLVKPSKPTPQDLRIYKLSFLDQIALKVYTPFIYFYSLKNLTDDNKDIAKISKRLKNSLSEALTLYYPLAGRKVEGQDIVECNDEGAHYLETRVNVKLSGFLKDPLPIELNKLIPFPLDELATIPLGVQLNVFECGEIALGISFSHHLGDALSSLMFIKGWLAICRGENEAVITPEFFAAEIFPPRDIGGYQLPVVVEKGMCEKNVTKRFVFESSKLETLRAKYKEEGMKRVSRIEALSTFLWTRFVESSKLAESEYSEKEYSILHAVNIRPRCESPLPNHSFGNYYSPSLTNGTIKSTGEEGHGFKVAKRLGEDIRKVDKGLVRFMRENGGALVEFLRGETERFKNGEVFRFFMTSFCRFPLYEADFGLGDPIWVSSAARGFPYAVVFSDDKTGHGIEAYVCLTALDMKKLVADDEFMSFVSPPAVVYV